MSATKGTFPTHTPDGVPLRYHIPETRLFVCGNCAQKVADLKGCIPDGWLPFEGGVCMGCGRLDLNHEFDRLFASPAWRDWERRRKQPHA